MRPHKSKATQIPANPSDRDGSDTIAIELGWHGAADWGSQMPHRPLAFYAVVLQTVVDRTSIGVGATALFSQI